MPRLLNPEDDDNPERFDNYLDELFGYPFSSDDDDPTLDEVFDDGVEDEFVDNDPYRDYEYRYWPLDRP